MNGSTRFWLVCSNESSTSYDLRRTAQCLRGAPLRALVRPADDSELARELSATLALAPVALPEFEPRATLDALAAEHDGRELAVVASASFIREAIALAVGIDAARVAAPAVASLTVLDWPAPSDPAARPALIGVDLDWKPPPPPKQRARFPGGPGSAPSGRG